MTHGGLDSAGLLPASLLLVFRGGVFLLLAHLALALQQKQQKTRAEQSNLESIICMHCMYMYAKTNLFTRAARTVTATIQTRRGGATTAISRDSTYVGK